MKKLIELADLNQISEKIKNHFIKSLINCEIPTDITITYDSNNRIVSVSAVEKETNNNIKSINVEYEDKETFTMVQLSTYDYYAFSRNSKLGKYEYIKTVFTRIEYKENSEAFSSGFNYPVTTRIEKKFAYFKEENYNAVKDKYDHFYKENNLYRTQINYKLEQYNIMGNLLISEERDTTLKDSISISNIIYYYGTNGEIRSHNNSKRCPNVDIAEHMSYDYDEHGNISLSVSHKDIEDNGIHIRSNTTVIYDNEYDEKGNLINVTKRNDIKSMNEGDKE